MYHTSIFNSWTLNSGRLVYEGFIHLQKTRTGKLLNKVKIVFEQNSIRILSIKINKISCVKIYIYLNWTLIYGKNINSNNSSQKQYIQQLIASSATSRLKISSLSWVSINDQIYFTNKASSRLTTLKNLFIIQIFTV